MTNFPARLLRRDLTAVILLGLVAFVLHGQGLGLGFWLDDNNHLELSHKNGWSGLATGYTFDWNQRIAHVWWATKETGWAYFRPLSVALRTLELDLFGLNPLPFHIIHLLIFLASLWLFYGVIRRWGGSTRVAFVASLLFVMNPSNSMTAVWLAVDGPMLVAVWTFLALWLLRASVEAEHRRAGLWLGIFLCYGLAMLSQESGAILGPMLVLCEWLAVWRGARNPQLSCEPIAAHLPQSNKASPRRRFLYAALFVEAITYFVIRSHYLQGAPLQHSPYFMWPSDPGFSSWVLYKSLSDFLSLTLGLPVFMFVNVGWLQERPVTTLGLTLLALVVATVFLYPLRRQRAIWAILACMALAMAPTLPTASATYHFYLVSACWAVLLALWAKQLLPRRPLLAASTLAVISGVYLAGTWSGAWTVYALATIDRTTRDAVQASGPAQFPPGTRIFFINLPLPTVESGPGIRLAANRPDLDFCPLTYSPDLFLPHRSATVRQENERTLLVQIDPPGWFSGRFGEQLELGWFGATRQDYPVGPVQIAPIAGSFPFRVEVVAADTRGITALRFVFDKPVNDPGYRFFMGTSDQGAQLLHFSGDGQAVTMEPGSPEQQNIMDRLRRMQIAFDRVTNFLARWP